MSMIESLLNCFVLALDMLAQSSRTATSPKPSSQNGKP